MKTECIKIIFFIILTIVVPINAFPNDIKDVNYARKLRIELSVLCKGIENSMICAQLIEHYQFKKGVKGVSRKGKKLIVKTNANKSLIFTDSEEDDTQGKWYQYLDYLSSIKCHLIHVQLFEGVEYILVHLDSGKHYIIKDVPVISPDKSRFVTVDICDAECSNKLYIYNVTRNGVTLEYTFEPKEYWAWTKLMWLSNGRIKIDAGIKGSGYNKPVGPAFVGKEILMVRTGETWHIEE